MNLPCRFSTLASCLLVAASVAGCAAQTSTSEDEGRDESPLRAGQTQDIINDQAPKTPLGPSKRPSVPVYGGGVGEGSSGTGAPVATCTPSKTLHTCTQTFDGLATTVNAVSSDTCGNATSFGNYICDPAYGVCVNACEAAADCATGFTCIGAQCVLPPGLSTAPADPLPHALTDPGTCFTTTGGLRRRSHRGELVQRHHDARLQPLRLRDGHRLQNHVRNGQRLRHRLGLRNRERVLRRR